MVSLTEKLQGKETSPSATTAAQEVDQPDEHTAASGTEKLLAQQLKDDLHSSGDCTGHGALSSEEEDGGVVSDEGSFDLPDAMFAAGVTHHGAEEAQLANWTSWFWNWSMDGCAKSKSSPGFDPVLHHIITVLIMCRRQKFSSNETVLML